MSFPGSSGGSLSVAQSFGNIGTIVREMLPYMELLIVEVGLIFGLLLAKAYDGTARNTYRVFQVLLISVVGALILALFFQVLVV